MEFPSIDRSFFLGDCFDAYRTLGAHPFPGRLAVRGVGPQRRSRGDLRRL